MQFTEREQTILANALTLAIEIWKKDMRETRDDGFLRLAEMFAQQVIDSEQLLTLIEQETCR